MTAAPTAGVQQQAQQQRQLPQQLQMQMQAKQAQQVRLQQGFGGGQPDYSAQGPGPGPHGAQAVVHSIRQTEEQRRAAEAHDIAERKRMRLENAPSKDQQRTLVPDYVAPFASRIDAWQRLLPYHCLHTSGKEEIAPEEWQKRVAGLVNKYAKWTSEIRETSRSVELRFDVPGDAAKALGAFAEYMKRSCVGQVEKGSAPVETLGAARPVTTGDADMDKEDVVSREGGGKIREASSGKEIGDRTETGKDSEGGKETETPEGMGKPTCNEETGQNSDMATKTGKGDLADFGTSLSLTDDLLLQRLLYADEQSLIPPKPPPVPAPIPSPANQVSSTSLTARDGQFLGVDAKRPREPGFPDANGPIGPDFTASIQPLAPVHNIMPVKHDSSSGAFMAGTGNVDSSLVQGRSGSMESSKASPASDSGRPRLQPFQDVAKDRFGPVASPSHQQSGFRSSGGSEPSMLNSLAPIPLRPPHFGTSPHSGRLASPAVGGPSNISPIVAPAASGGRMEHGGGSTDANNEEPTRSEPPNQDNSSGLQDSAYPPEGFGERSHSRPPEASPHGKGFAAKPNGQPPWAL